MAVKRTRSTKLRGKPFPKGVSGNPKGRPPLTPDEREFRELCRQHSAAALERIAKRAKGKTMVAQRADEYLVDRGYGKPRQEVATTVTGKDGGPVQVETKMRLSARDLSDEDRRVVREIIERRSRASDV